jgi:hypothetical protein
MQQEQLPYTASAGRNAGIRDYGDTSMHCCLLNRIPDKHG